MLNYNTKCIKYPQLIIFKPSWLVVLREMRESKWKPYSTYCIRYCGNQTHGLFSWFSVPLVFILVAPYTFMHEDICSIQLRNAPDLALAYGKHRSWSCFKFQCWFKDVLLEIAEVCACAKYGLMQNSIIVEGTKVFNISMV